MKKIKGKAGKRENNTGLGNMIPLAYVGRKTGKCYPTLYKWLIRDKNGKRIRPNAIRNRFGVNVRVEWKVGIGWHIDEKILSLIKVNN